MAEGTLSEKPLQEEAPKQSETRVSRRGFLRTIGMGAKLAALDTVLSHIPTAPSLGKAFWEQLETATLGVPSEDLRKELEGKFNIEIVGPNTGVREIETHSHAVVPTVEWDSPRLKKLVEYLVELPPHFYSPRETERGEKKLRVALVDQSLLDFTKGNILGVPSFCVCSEDVEHPTVVLDRKTTGSTVTDSLLTREVVAHEFTHAVTTPEIVRYMTKITTPIGLDTIPELRKAFSPVVILTSEGKAMGIMPRNVWEISEYSAPRYNLKIIMVDKNRLDSDRSVITVVEQKGEDFYFEYYKEGKQIGQDRLIRVNSEWYVIETEFSRFGETFFRDQYDDYQARITEAERFGGKTFSISIPGIDATYLSYGATNFEEFFSIAATFFIRGHDRFVGTYEPFLGKERAEKLYEGMKREIFRGREY